MRRALATLPALALLAFAPACDSDESDLGDDFRGGLDVNIQLSQADGGDDDGTILWEILGGDVYDGPATNGNLSLYIENNTIHTAAGQATCVVNAPYLNSTMREVIAANGTDVLFTVWNNYVFQGEINPKVESYGHMKKLFGDQLLFELSTNEIYLGETRDGFRLVSATADVEFSSDGRKLLLAALITGECGATGMPGYTF